MWISMSLEPAWSKRASFTTAKAVAQRNLVSKNNIKNKTNQLKTIRERERKERKASGTSRTTSKSLFMVVSFRILKRYGGRGGEKGRKEYTTILKKNYGPNFLSLMIAAVGPRK